jgi:hypothetical protein
MASTVPAVDGWFTSGEDPHLIGSRCAGCGTYAFPPESYACRNPVCSSAEMQESPLSARGTLWSFAVNHYPPPPPALTPEPFEPYGVAAVHLAEENMVVLGMVASGTDPATLAIGDEMHLVVEPVVAGAGELVWKWGRA